MTTVAQLLEQKGHDIQAVAPDDTVYDAIKRMADLDIGALVVLEEGKVVMTTNNPDYGEARVEVDAEYSGKTIVVGFNHRYLVDVLVPAGYVVVAPTYRQILRGGAVRAAVEDMRDAIRWWNDNADSYGADPDEVAVVGLSAGAATSVIALADAPQPKCFMGIYGPYDFTALPMGARGIGARLLLGGTSPDRWNVPSPLAVPSLKIPVALMHGTHDQLVDIAHTRALIARRRADGLDTELTVYPGARHGFLHFPKDPAFEPGRRDVLSFLERAAA